MWWPVLSACIFLFQDFSTLVKLVQLVTLSHSFNSYNNTFSINVQFLNVENVKINYMEKTLFLIPPQGNFSNWWNFDNMIYKFLNLNWSLAFSLYKCFSISVKKKQTSFVLEIFLFLLFIIHCILSLILCCYQLKLLPVLKIFILFPIFFLLNLLLLFFFSSIILSSSNDK